MLTTNIDISDKLINGQMGVVHDFAISDSKISKIYIKFDDPNAGLKLMRSDVYANNNNAVPISRTEADVPLTNTGTSYSVKRTQFPLMLGWACTIHKVQGLTLRKVALSTELRKMRQFGHGQIYVALSRITSIDNLHIIGKLTIDLIRANPLVSQEYAQLRANAIFFNSVHNGTKIVF